MAKKPFLGVPGGNVRVENPDGVTRTFGDGQRNNLIDANCVSSGGFAYGAFPNEGDDFPAFPSSDDQPTMRKPVNE